MREVVQIVTNERDDHRFIRAVQQIVNATAERSSCDLVLIKIDNWFGSRWLDFSGKLIGLLGVRKERRTVPPFTPNRVVWQRRFGAPSYMEVDIGNAIHIDISGKQGLTRYLDLAEPNSCIWFSGDSGESGRGSVMVYVPEGDTFLTWYASFALEDDLRVVECLGISLPELALIRDSSPSLRSASE